MWSDEWIKGWFPVRRPPNLDAPGFLLIRFCLLSPSACSFEADHSHGASKQVVHLLPALYVRAHRGPDVLQEGGNPVVAPSLISLPIAHPYRTRAMRASGRRDRGVCGDLRFGRWGRRPWDQV